MRLTLTQASGQTEWGVDSTYWLRSPDPPPPGSPHRIQAWAPGPCTPQDSEGPSEFS